MQDSAALSPKLSSDKNERPGVQLSLNLADSQGNGKRKVKVKRLDIGYADDENGIKWGGQTYETEDGRIDGELVEPEQNMEDGIEIRATEVVLLTFI